MSVKAISVYVERTKDALSADEVREFLVPLAPRHATWRWKPKKES